MSLLLSATGTFLPESLSAVIVICLQGAGPAVTLLEVLPHFMEYLGG
jgi:hypothetical protein